MICVCFLLDYLFVTHVNIANQTLYGSKEYVPIDLSKKVSDIIIAGTRQLSTTVQFYEYQILG